MIPIPDQMRHLKVDPRGYAIPWSVVMDTGGTAHFAIADEEKRRKAINHSICSLCGKGLPMKRWFIGGAKPAFHPMGAYLDPPMHRVCSHYALQVCPYIAAPSYAKEIAMVKAKARQEFLPPECAVILTDENSAPGRPPGDLFVALSSIGTTVIPDGPYAKPKLPYKDLEFWLHGKEISMDEGVAIIRRSDPGLISIMLDHPNVKLDWSHGV